MNDASALSPREGQPPAIVIAGGGFSGAAAAIALLVRLERPFRLFIVEPSRTLGGGVAYGAARRDDLLNVRAEDMRLRADLPNDFFAWLAGEDLLDAEAFAGSHYATRRTFAAYVGVRLKAAASARPDVAVRHVRSAATEVSRGVGARYRVRLEDGSAIDADAAVMATGYGAQRPSSVGYSPFEDIPAPVLRKARRAAIIGSGLSAIDAALHLARVSRASITLYSRHGLKPLAQAAGPSLSTPWTGPPPATARAAVRAVRARILTAAAEGKDWRAVLNGLRPVTQAIWLGFSDRDRRRFMRHLKPYWDVNRHRMAARTALAIKQLEDDGRLAFRAATVGAAPDGSANVRMRGSAGVNPLDADLVVECRGHRPDAEAPLLRSLIDFGLAVPDAVGWGIAVTPSGRIIGRSREPAPGLFAIGPVGAGSLLELTASPEIAAQAWQAAAELSADLEPSLASFGDGPSSRVRAVQ